MKNKIRMVLIIAAAGVVAGSSIVLAAPSKRPWKLAPVVAPSVIAQSGMLNVSLHGALATPGSPKAPVQSTVVEGGNERDRLTQHVKKSWTSGGIRYDVEIKRRWQIVDREDYARSQATSHSSLMGILSGLGTCIVSGLIATKKFGAAWALLIGAATGTGTGLFVGGAIYQKRLKQYRRAPELPPSYNDESGNVQ